MNEVLMFAGYAIAAGAFLFAIMTRKQLSNTKLVLAEALIDLKRVRKNYRS